MPFIRTRLSQMMRTRLCRRRPVDDRALRASLIPTLSTARCLSFASLFAFLALLPACGSFDAEVSNAAQPTDASRPTQEAPNPAQCTNFTEVQMADQLTYSPSTLQVRVGETVRFVNNSGMPHTVTADPTLAKDPANASVPEGVPAFNSGIISPGQAWTYTFNTPGTYTYFCIPHEQGGMVGTITVSP